MQLGTPNQIEGRVKAITLANVAAEVVVEALGREFVSLLPRTSVEALGLQVGDAVTAFVNPNDLQIAKA